MPKLMTGPLSQQFSGRASTSNENAVKRKRAGDDFIDTRFKFASSASKSKKLRLNLSTVVSSHTGFALELEGKNRHECHFTSALQAASLENLSIPFKKLHKTIEPLSRSLPLLIHHQEEIVHQCCAALIVQDSKQLEESPDSFGRTPKPFKSGKRKHLIESEKEKSRRMLKARENVNLVAATVLDILPPLIVDLSTSLLKLSTAPSASSRCPFEELLITLIYYINLPDAEPISLEKATEVIVHLFKTLAKDLAPSADETRDESDENSGMLRRIWQLVRVALGAPLLDAQMPAAAEDKCSDDGGSESNLEEEASNESGLDSDDENDVAVDEAKLSEGADELLDEFQEERDHQASLPPENLPSTCGKELSGLDIAPTTASLPSHLNVVDFDDLYRRVLKSTTPSSRRLVATSFAFLIRKQMISQVLIEVMLEDLNRVEVDEIAKHGNLRPRKQKEQVGRKGLTKRSLLGEESGGAKVFAEGICLTLSESCKSIDHRLHSRAGEIVLATDSQLVKMASSAYPTTPHLSGDILNSLLIAVLHHSTAEYFEGVLTAMIQKTTQRLAESKACQASPEKCLKIQKDCLALETSLRCLATAAGVRHGSRLTPTRKNDLFKIFDNLLDLISSGNFSPSASILSLTMSFALNLFSAIKDSSEFLSTPEVRKSIDRLFSVSTPVLPIEHTYQLALSLSESQWPFFDDFILTKLYSIVHHQISDAELLSGSSSAVSVLVNLGSVGHNRLPEELVVVVNRAIERAIQSIIHHLSSFRATSQLPQDQAATPSTLSLLSLQESYDWLDICTSLSPSHVSIDHSTIDQYYQHALFPPHHPTDLADLEELKRKYVSNYESGIPFNQTMLLCKIFEITRHTSSSASSGSAVSLLDRLPFILSVWGWHPTTLRVVYDLCQDVRNSGLDLPTISFASIYQPLKLALLSENDMLRCLVLQILSITSPPHSTLDKILRQCLKIEQTALLVENARDRQMHIRKLGIMVKSHEAVETQPEVIDLAQRLLIGQLKVHFKPLWEEAIKALTDINESRQGSFWELVWDQLSLTLINSPDLYYSPRVQLTHHETDDQDGLLKATFTDNPQFMCTNLNKLGTVCTASLKSRSLNMALKNQQLDSRLDIQNYESQLLNLLCHNSAITQKHNKVIIEAFFTFCQAGEEELEQGHMLGRSARTRLKNWLPLFAKFSNPKSLYRSTDLRTACYDLLADPDAELRRLALDWLLTWKDGAIVRHHENLRDLLDSSLFRDVLLKFSLSSEASQISQSDRSEVIPVAIRLLFGSILMNQGRSSSQGKAPRKSAILSALKGCSIDEIDMLINLMLRPLTSSARQKGYLTVLTKKELGFLSLLGEVMKSLGRNIVHRWGDFLDLIVEIISISHPELHASTDVLTVKNLSLEAQPKRIRIQCIHRLNDFFSQAPPSFSFQPWIHSVFKMLIVPRLPSFASETAQAPSALLELFHTWSSRQELMSTLIEHDPNVLTAVYQILAIPNVKPLVIKRVFDILENVLRNVESNPELTADKYLKPYFRVLLPNLSELLRRSSASFSLATSISRRQITILSALAPFITEPEHAESFCELILPLLSKSQVMVPEHIQADLLTIFARFLSNAPKVATCPTTLKAISKLFGTVSSRKGRRSLVGAVESISKLSNGTIGSTIVLLLADLNSFSTKRIDEPDFERRLNAFVQLNEKLYRELNALEWELLVHHSMFQIRDPEELSLRGSSASALCRFLELAESTDNIEIRELLAKVMIPGLKKVLRSKLEVIRQEVLVVLADAVARDLPDVAELKEMRCLLVGGDKEANFFLNVYHIQIHRRIRALKRLGDESEARRLSSKVLLEIFLPLLIPIFLPATSSRSDPDLVNEAIRTMGRVAKALSWSAYNSVLQFYNKILHKPESANKTTVRVVVSIMKNFHFNLHSDADPEGTRNLTEAPEHASASISAKLIPTLIKFMEQQKEGGPDESLRIMIAEGVAFVATFLPYRASQSAISGIVSSLSNILKSTHQDTRQSAKVAMANIAALLPPSFLRLLLKELNAVLTRGPQLHVLAHVVHAIISRTGEVDDYKVPQDAVKPLMEIITDDLFGQASKDRQSKELKAKTKFNETKTSRSLETLQMLVGRLSSSDEFTEVLRPFRHLLETTRSVKALKRIDECFHRICAGVVSNKEKFDASTVLKLVHTLISRNSEFLKDKSQKKQPKVINPTDHRVVLSLKHKGPGDHYAANAHHFVSLGLDMFNTVYRRAGFDLHSPIYLEMIDPLVNLVGNTLYTHNSDVLARGLKVMSILIKLPLPAIERSATVIVRQMLAVVSQIGSSESELSQIALKTLGTVIRDCKKVDLTEKQLTGLLNLIAPDLEDPDRQTTLFALLKGIMSKKFMAPELYDLMDRIVRLLVTAQSGSVREICRSVFLQFLLDYPQGKGRLAGSLEFLVKNLAYEHESGRQSVLEILNAINMKFSVDLISKNADLFVMALVMRVANETSVNCKEMAIEVLKVIFTRIESEKAFKYLNMMLTWSKNLSGPTELRWTAVQLAGVYVEVRGSEDWLNIEAVHRMLCTTVENLATQLTRAEEEEEATSTSLDWQLAYQCLQALSKVYKAAPTLLRPVRVDKSCPEWEAIKNLLLFPHAWVRASAARLIGTMLSAANNQQLPPFDTANLVSIARKSSLQLRSKQLDDALALQIVKNLFFVLKTLKDRSSLNATSSATNQTSGNLPGGSGSAHEVGDNDATADNQAGEDDDSDSDSDSEREKDEKMECPEAQMVRLVKQLSRQANIAHGKRPSVFAADANQWAIEPSSVLRCFAALINHLTSDELTGILRPLMIPIFRINEDSNVKDPQMSDLQNLAKEIQEFLREKVGTTRFSQVYGQLRAAAMEKRQERKKLVALKAVNQPELGAKRKASRAETKLRGRKRKQESFAAKNALHGKSKKRGF